MTWEQSAIPAQLNALAERVGAGRRECIGPS
jgi:hypothetical protein